LRRFRDRSIPKLFGLRRAERAGFAVPPSWWCEAPRLRDAPTIGRPPASGDGPLIVRSGSPTEDTAATSNAGQFLSVTVEPGGDFPAAVRAVVAALPGGGAQGVVFVQPLLRPSRAGVTFFDGFYFEETSAPGGNARLTAGSERGEVERGHVRRGSTRDAWLERLYALVGGPIDAEWAEDDAGRRTLLQVRPALFPVLRNETLSLANHREILGDPPSPWMVGLLAEAARPAMTFFHEVDPATAAWDEPYAVELAGRAWLNFSAFYRMMDRWGLPRSLVTDGVGGRADPADRNIKPGRLLRSLSTLLRLQAANLRAVREIPAGLARLDSELDGCATLADLQRANVRALVLAIRTNFAINGILSGVMRLRTRLGVRAAGRVVTAAMMTAYAELAADPDGDRRRARLDAWLEAYGHRGPFESDPARPRYRELRAALREDLEQPRNSAQPTETGLGNPFSRLFLPLFWIDGVREGFRDDLMRWWERLRGRVLAEAGRAREEGWLDDPEDVFHLRSEDLAGDPSRWREAIARRRAEAGALAAMILPDTADRETIRKAPRADALVEAGPARTVFEGIGLGSKVFRGKVFRAADVTEVLRAGAVAPGSVLLAPSLEPSWAVVFPRFAGVVADLGGELSHAAILLREAGIPAVVNARGAYAGLPHGATVELDPARGRIALVGEVPLGDMHAPSR
jgi:pyruvate,water dikinase